MRRYIAKSLVFILGIALLISAGIPVSAAERHEDPDTAKVAFSGISLFQYYSGVLDFVLNKDLDEVTGRLSKMPFANIPEEIKKPVDGFVTSVSNITIVINTIGNDIGLFNKLVQQSRFEEAVNLASSLSDNISMAKMYCGSARVSVEETGEKLGATSSRASDKLKQTYNEVLEKLDKILELLNLHEIMLTDTLGQHFGIIHIESLRPTEITLQIEPDEAFVGSTVSFSGLLTSKGEPLIGREVSILVGGIESISAKTDSRGYYSGTLRVPYRYISGLEIRSLYSPQGKDIDVYLAGISPEELLNLLFYRTELTVSVDDRAYPGLSTGITGEFDYAQHQYIEERRVEIYLDDIPVSEFFAGESFVQEILISPDTEIGLHSLVVSVEGKERYSPVIVDRVLNISRMVPMVEITTPGLALMPGSIDISGRLSSILGPLGNTPVEIVLGGTAVETVTSPDGYFESEIGTGFNFGIIGSQDIVVKVIPEEPWFSTYRLTRKIMLLNIVTVVIAVIVLVMVSVYLPGRIKKTLKGLAGRKTGQEKPTVEAVQEPEYGEMVSSVPETGKNERTPLEPGERILHWYRTIIGIIQRVSKSVLQPNQTLREYAESKKGILGPAAGYLMQFTLLVEKLLYSRYTPTTVDVENSQRLFTELGDETVYSADRVPVSIEKAEPVPETGISEPETAGRAAILEYSREEPSQNGSRRLPVWVLAFLIITIAYYAGIILFLLPLLAVSVGSFLPVVIIDDSRTRDNTDIPEEDRQA